MQNNSRISEWFVLTLETVTERPESIVEMLREAAGVEPVELARPESELCWIEAYFTSEVAAEVAAAAFGGVEGVSACSVRRSDPHDWSQFWKHHFHGRKIGQRFFIKPEWEELMPPEDLIEIILNPGLSFGTGDHFTTRFCLESLDDLAAAGVGGSLLDMGTGSGILAIAGSMLGFQPVRAVDHDPACIDQARKNAAMNGVDSQLDLGVFDIREPWAEDAFDVVCANLYGGLLFERADALLGMCRTHLILSGIKEPELDGIAERYLATGLREKVRDSDGEWAGLAFEIPRA